MFYGYPHKTATGDFLKARAIIPITPSYRKQLWVLKCLPIIITSIFINEELQFTPHKHTIIRQMHALCNVAYNISEENLYKDRACFVVLCFVPAGIFCPHQSWGYLTIYGTTQTICVRVRKSHESAKTACMYMSMSFLVMIYYDCPMANRTTLTNTTKYVT